MNRIETKIIIMVTNKLAAAKDSDAKTEMIEELGENLYQRYLELTQQGMPEEEALAKAMESLGDVEELLAFLRETETQAETVQSGGAQTDDAQTDDAQTDDTQSENAQTESRQADDAQTESTQTENSQTDWSAEFKKDLESGIDAFMNIAQATAKVAQTTAQATAKAAHETAKVTADYAKDVAKEVSEQWKEHYPDGVFYQYEEPKGEKVDCTAVQVTDAIHSLDIHLMNGNLTLQMEDTEDTLIKVDGDTQDVETILREDGVLSIRQENTASTSFFFLRGMRRCDIIVTLPKKVWNQIKISTVNGDVQVENGLECRELNVNTVSGDLQIGNIICDQAVCHSGSGDIDVEHLAGNLYAATKSGDVEARGQLGNCELRSVSGDVDFRGESYEVKCSSTSGDAELDLDCVPRSVDLSSISGDCEIRMPRGEAMHISYRTVSGDFSTNLPLSASMTKRRGEVTLGEGEPAQIQVSSTSGDIDIYVK